MKLVIKGTEQFKSLIASYHESFMKKVLVSIPKYSKLKNTTISVIETSNLEVIGKSKFTSNELLINHQLTRDNPKFLYEVYGHELAHFLSTLYFQKNIQHGSEWVKIMKVMGLPPRESAPISQEKMNQLGTLSVQCSCLFGGRKEKTQAALKVSPSCRVCNQEYVII